MRGYLILHINLVAFAIRDFREVTSVVVPSSLTCRRFLIAVASPRFHRLLDLCLCARARVAVLQHHLASFARVYRREGLQIRRDYCAFSRVCVVSSIGAQWIRTSGNLIVLSISSIRLCWRCEGAADVDVAEKNKMSAAVIRIVPHSIPVRKIRSDRVLSRIVNGSHRYITVGY